jgi:DNA-binding NarL/FixJ family response regulator
MDKPECRIRVLLAEDHDLLRAGLRELLALQPDIEVVAEATDGADAVRLAGEYRPDVVVMDVRLPTLSGPDATRAILVERPTTAVLGLSAHSTRRVVDSMLEAGARGYVPKASVVGELAAAIREVAAGRQYASPRLQDT